jgi:hypothetical protein
MGQHTNTVTHIDCFKWVPAVRKSKLNGTGEVLKWEGKRLPNRNEPCICGSNHKFKKCCGAKFSLSLEHEIDLPMKIGF